MSNLIEELSLNAWPALQTLCYDGWLLRFANAYTSRANSVNPIYPSTLPILDKIRYCEQLYSASRQNTIFKLTSDMAYLDTTLTDLGYSYLNLTNVQTLDLTLATNAVLVLNSRANNEDLELSLTPSLTKGWLDTFCRINNIQSQHLPTLTQMLNLIVPTHCFALLYKVGQPIATGLAVLERGQVGLFEIATDVAYRNQGLARWLITHLLCWGREQGAKGAYLQVTGDNIPALKLYHTLGFKDSYQYWYRVKPLL